MRLNLRLLAAIWLTIMVVLGAFAYVSAARERTRLSTEMERRAWLHRLHGVVIDGRFGAHVVELCL